MVLKPELKETDGRQGDLLAHNAPGSGRLARMKAAPQSQAGPPQQPLLLLVDGHSLAFRSFYAFAKGGEGGLATKEGVPTSVTYGFLKALLDNVKGLTPPGVVIAFDTAEPTFRHEARRQLQGPPRCGPGALSSAIWPTCRRSSLGPWICPCAWHRVSRPTTCSAPWPTGAANAGWRVRISRVIADLFQLVDDARDIAVLYMGGGPYAKSSGPLLIRSEGVVPSSA